MTTSDKPVITKETKMSKKKLETANENIPEDEMFLAMILQNVKARDIGFCENTMYRDLNYISHCSAEEAMYACAVGAARLENDTTVLRDSFVHIIFGNDEPINWTVYLETDNLDGETVGWAYRQAMTIDE